MGDKIPLKDASRLLKINYNSAKTIMNVYKKQGRIKKKLTRKRRAKNSPSNSCDSLVKQIFQIQKIKVDGSAAESSTESLKKPEANSKPEFSFTIYGRRIIEEYCDHIRRKLETQVISYEVLSYPFILGERKT